MRTIKNERPAGSLAAVLIGMMLSGTAPAADAPVSAGGDGARAAESGKTSAEPELRVITVGEPDPWERDGGGARGAEPDDNVTDLGTLTVTASKREQRQQDVAGSVDALRGEDLEAINAQGLADYIKQVPGVVLLERDMDASVPIIRGIATSTAPLGIITTQLPVGIYIDDMPFNDLYLPLSVPDLNPFDLARVEVLKGPQGTLFGSGALAGAIRYVTQKPKLGEWETKLRTSVSGNRQSDGLSQVIAGAQNLPLTGDTAALRVAGHYRTQAGTIDEVDRGTDLDDKRQYSGRLQGRWEPTSRLGLSGFVIKQESTQVNTADSDYRDRFERELTGESWRQSGFSGSNFSTRYGFDGFDFLSSTNYLTKNVKNDGTEPFGAAPADSSDPGGANGTGTEDAGKTDTLIYQLFSQTQGWFQEFRFSSPEDYPWAINDWISVSWLGGLGYQRTGQDWQQYIESTDAHNALEPAQDTPLIPLQTPLGPFYGTREASLLYAELDSVASEVALFGEAETRLGDHWAVALGARVFKTKLVSEGFVSGSQATAFDAGSTRTEVHREVPAQGLNPKVALRYLHSDALQFYALAAKGFQFGGVQVNPPATVLQQSSPEALGNYDSSKLWNYEIGLRSNFFSSKLRFELTVFYLDWKDLQISVRGPLVPEGDNVGLTIGYIQNIGSARSQGAEAMLALAPWSWLDIVSSASWVDAKTISDFDSANGFVPAGTRLPASPEFQWSTRLSLKAPERWLSRFNLQTSLIHAHIGRSYNDLQYSSEQGGYDTLDLAVSLSQGDGAFRPEFGLSVLNLADERGVAAVTGAEGTRDVDYYLVRPRTTLLSLGFRY